MVKFLAPALLLLAACTSSPPPPESKRVDIVLRNTLEFPIELRASVGIFCQRIPLAPGQLWRGWIPADVSVGEVRVEIAEDSRLHAVR